MRHLDSPRSWFPGLFVCALLSTLAAGCNGDSSSYRSPTAPAPSVPTPSPPSASPASSVYVAEAVVLSSTEADRGCEWWESNSSVWWAIQITGDSIVLDEEMELLFEGTIRGHSFDAIWRASADYQSSPCPVRESSISGTFSEDFGTFEALETIAWGAPEHQATTQRRWSAVRQ